MMHLMKRKELFFIFSMVIIIPGLISLVLFGLKLGIDFTGGNVLQYKFSQPVTVQTLDQEIRKVGGEPTSIVSMGQNTYRIKTKSLEEKNVTQLKNNLEADLGTVEVQASEAVGPTFSSELTTNAFKALLFASGMIVLYIAWAFRQVPKPASSWRFGITAVLALLHDVLVLVGVFSLLGHFIGVEVDVLFVTALLTVIGFSVHDTIVVFDRIRENLPKHLAKPFSEVANLSIVQTLARSLNTSLTVVFVLLALLLFGGGSIHWFVVALLVGIISGTYSSIFNATALLCMWEERLGH